MSAQEVPSFDVPATHRKARVRVDVVVNKTVYLDPDAYVSLLDKTGEEFGLDPLTMAVTYAVDDVIGYEPQNEWQFAAGAMDQVREQLRNPRWEPIAEDQS